MTGIRDVTGYAGVSPSMVSRMLSGVVLVEPEMKEKVLKAVSDLNYKPSLAAGSLKWGGSRLIGLIIPDITNPYFPETVKYMELRATETGYSLILCDSLGDVEEERGYFERLRYLFVDGISHISATDSAEHVKPYIREIPMIIINRALDVDAPCFNIDNREVADQAVKYLIQNDHGKIALYSNDKNRQYNQECLEGCMEIWSQCHQEHNPTVIWDVTSEEDACQRTMESVKNPNRLAAVFLFSDPTADGMYSRIRKSGLTILNDISVVGFDDIPHVKYLNPPLITVHHSLPEVSKVISDYLLSQVMTQTCTPHNSVYLKGQLIEREPVRKLI